MENETSFRTKTGHCHVLPDRIVLTREGEHPETIKDQGNNEIARILLLYAGIAAALLYYAYGAYRSGQNLSAVVSGLLALYLLYGTVVSIHHSTTSSVSIKSIRSVRFKKAIPGLTRSRFEVLFEDKHGKLKKRLIMLPGSFSGGDIETAKALKVMERFI